MHLPVSRRRFRRKETEIRQLILDAARQEFGRAGYAVTTTRAIAKLAGVSESLVFRYFGSKAALFDIVVFGPFNDLMARFNKSHTVPQGQQMHISNSRVFVRELLTYLRDNRMLVTAFVQNSVGCVDEAGLPFSSGLANYFARSQESVEIMQRKANGYADPSIGLAVRLGFSAVLGSVLFSNWLFGTEEPEIDTLTDGLVRMLVRILEPDIRL
jgi:AcrR family transcriptional regulator